MTTIVLWPNDIPVFEMPSDAVHYEYQDHPRSMALLCGTKPSLSCRQQPHASIMLQRETCWCPCRPAADQQSNLESVPYMDRCVPLCPIVSLSFPCHISDMCIHVCLSDHRFSFFLKLIPRQMPSTRIQYDTSAKMSKNEKHLWSHHDTSRYVNVLHRLMNMDMRERVPWHSDASSVLQRNFFSTELLLGQDRPSWSFPVRL